MKKVLCLLIILFYNSLHLQAQRFNKNIPSTTKIYNEEGKVIMLIAYDPGCSCKTYTEFFSDGKIFAKRVFKLTEKGEKVDGEDVTYFHDGSIKIYRNWKDALPVGRFYFNHDNGNLEHEEFYEGEYKTGTWKYYDAFGHLIREKIYEPQKTLWNSKKDIAVYKYYQNGQLTRTEKVQGGIKNVNGKKSAVAGSVKVKATDGKTLYELRCKACHDPQKDGYGPAVINFSKNRSNVWLFNWIKDAQKLIDAGDKDAVTIFKKWGNKPHFPQTQLSDEQIQAIIKYLNL